MLQLNVTSVLSINQSSEVFDEVHHQGKNVPLHNIQNLHNGFSVHNNIILN